MSCAANTDCSDALVDMRLVRVQQQASNVVLRVRVVDGSQQCEVLAVAVHDELSGRE